MKILKMRLWRFHQIVSLGRRLYDAQAPKYLPLPGFLVGPWPTHNNVHMAISDYSKDVTLGGGGGMVYGLAQRVQPEI